MGSSSKPADQLKDSNTRASNQESHDTCRRPSKSPADGLYRARPVRLSDEDLRTIAAETRLSTEWENILLSARAGPGRWKTQHKEGEFTVYTRHESHRIGVLAVGLVSGGAGEIMNVLQCERSAQYAQHMASVFEDQFKDGAFVYHVPSTRQAKKKNTVELADLSVKTVTFQKAGWLARHHEEWCYLDAVYRHGDTGAAEKLMTTLDPHSVLMGLSAARTKLIEGVTCAYLLLPDAPQTLSKSRATHTSNQDGHDEAKATMKRTRVHFHGEYLVPKHLGIPVPAALGGASATDKAMRYRLLRLADSCARLDTLVRRQRLGVQDVVDCTRVLPPTNTPCRVCTKMLMVAKVCRLCGLGVCSDCSKKHERAVLPTDGSSAMRVELVRVCADCMYRVDRACYDNLTPASLRGPHVVPDPIDTTPPTDALRELLHDALIKAPSPSRKAGVMNVIKYVLDLETPASTPSSSASSSPSSPLLTPTSSERDYLAALDYLDVPHLSPTQAACRTHEERCYRVDASDPDAALNAPLAECEEERLRAVAQLDLDELSESVELQLLCQLAAKEMDCSTSTISIFDRDNLNCVATNVDAYAKLKLPRWNTMCAHTILDKTPHLIPHPEADIRMADALVVSGYGVRFYFAFPVVDAGGQIIGSYCVMNEHTRAVTAAQYSAFQKLSETCNKVVRVHTETRRSRSGSMASSTTSEDQKLHA